MSGSSPRPLPLTPLPRIASMDRAGAYVLDRILGVPANHRFFGAIVVQLARVGHIDRCIETAQPTDKSLGPRTGLEILVPV